VSPDWILHRIPSHPVSSWVARRIAYPIWLRHYHPHYARFARQFHKTQHFTPEELERWQSQRLREQLLHAFRNIPFYRRRFEMNGITPLDIRTPEDLKALPVLTKADLRRHDAELLARNIPPESRVQQQAVGANGMPVRFWVDKERLDSRRAALDRHNAWAGLYPGAWYAQLSGFRTDANPAPQQTGWSERLIDHRLQLNTSLIGERDLEQYIGVLRRFRPRVLVANAQSAVFFARYCEQSGIRDIHFRTIIVTAEMLLPGQRAFLEEVFHARVFNRYSSCEFSVIASDCPDMKGMHVSADALIVEVESSTNASRAGRVLITDLLNRAMPLIRYEIGDTASPLRTAVCSCGRAFPRMANVRGRVTDFLVTADNRRVAGLPLAAIAGDMPQVRQIQFVQKDRGHIQLRIVPGGNYGADTVAELRRRLNPMFHGNTEISIVTVEQIQSERLGKFRVARTTPGLTDTIARPWSA
jgi:phenylacetate-CoA ligase